MQDLGETTAATALPVGAAPHPGSLAGLRAAGTSDAALGLERRTGALLDAMVARQKILDDVKSDIAARREKARIAHDRALSSVRQRKSDDLERIEADASEALTAAESRAEGRRLDLEARRARRSAELQSSHDDELAKLSRGLEEALLMAEAMREAGEEGEKRKTKELAERLARAMEEARALETEAKDYIRSCRLPIPQIEDGAVASAPSAVPAEEEIAQLLVKGREHLDAILTTRAARLIAGPAPFVLAPAVVIGAGVIGGAFTLFDEASWAKVAGISAGAALVLVVVAFITLRGIALAAMRRVWTPFQSDLAAIRAAKDRAEREHAEDELHFLFTAHSRFFFFAFRRFTAACAFQDSSYWTIVT
jgi:hypothetical protein